MVPKRLLQAIENGNVKKFYKSTIWKHKRKKILKENNFECQRCKSKGKFSKAEVVHHIKHLREFPHLALKDENLLPVCAACHNELHPEKLEKFKSNWKSRKKPITPERW